MKGVRTPQQPDEGVERSMAHVQKAQQSLTVAQELHGQTVLDLRKLQKEKAEQKVKEDYQEEQGTAGAPASSDAP